MDVIDDHLFPHYVQVLSLVVWDTPPMLMGELEISMISWCSSRLVFRGLIGNDLSGHYFDIFVFSTCFPCFLSPQPLFFCVVYFSHRRSAWIQKLI